uniref:Uncharacterized protein n=1 Tax=Tanacetum cinerariifolium TaxID=118510 RepID=A0A699HTM0_TANCI|nr:hypothetical protein [Tanacetum cinerariifolium]
MKLATKRSLVLTHISHASGFGADEGTGGKPGVLNVPTYESDNEKISWKSSEEEDDDEVGMNDDDNDDADNQDDDSQEDDGQDDEGQDDDNEQTDSDNDGDDFVHPKFSTHDQDERQDEEDSFDPRVQTPSHVESTNDEDNDEEIQGVNVEEDELDKEDKGNELYRDVNVNLEGRDIEMIDAQQKNVQTTQVIEDTHVIITPVNPEGQQKSFSVSYGFVSNMLNPNPDTGIDSIFNLNTESTSLVDVLVTTLAELPLLSATTLYPPPTPLIADLQQIPVPTPANVLSSSLQDLPNFGSLFGRRDDKDKDEEPSAGSKRGSKRRRAGKEPDSASAPKEKPSKTTGKSTEGSKSHHNSMAQMEDPLESFIKLMDNPLDFSAFVMNRLKVDALTPELLAGRQVIPFDHFINNDLAYLSGGVLSKKYTTSVTKTKAADYRHIKWIEDLVPNTMWSQVPVSYDKESARDVYSKRRIIAVTKLQIVEWHNYKHLDWITVHRDDYKLYKFKEVNFNRLHIQDIEVMLLLLV